MNECLFQRKIQQQTKAPETWSCQLSPSCSVFAIQPLGGNTEEGSGRERIMIGVEEDESRRRERKLCKHFEIGSRIFFTGKKKINQQRNE